MADPGPSRPSASLPFRVRALLPLLLLVLGYVSVEFYGRVPPTTVGEVSGEALGTTWSVKLALADATAEELRRVSELVGDRLAEVDAGMSTWRDDSELMRFNAAATTEPVSISPETAQVVEIALDVAAQSGGALDVTVGPLVDAWGFGSAGRSEPPSEARLASLREAVGWRKLTLLPGPALRKQHPKLRVDLSAVAKGFAVDQIALGLEGLGHTGFLVEVGGELRGRGTHLAGEPWRVAIEAPYEAGRRIHRIVALRDLAMATSGDYRNYYEIEGRRVSHTIDPRTGRPIEHALASVSVLHREAAGADAWATALNVLGPEAGYALAVDQGLAAYFIVRNGDAFEVRTTPAFEPHLVDAAARGAQP